MSPQTAASFADAFEDWAIARKLAAEERDRRARAAASADLDRWHDDGGCVHPQARKGA